MLQIAPFEDKAESKAFQSLIELKTKQFPPILLLSTFYSFSLTSSFQRPSYCINFKLFVLHQPLYCSVLRQYFLWQNIFCLVISLNSSNPFQNSSPVAFSYFTITHLQPPFNCGALCLYNAKDHATVK